MGQAIQIKQKFFQNSTSMQKEPIRYSRHWKQNRLLRNTSGHQMTMFDFLDTKAVTEPTVVDMSDVEEIEEEEVTAKEDIPENQEQEITETSEGQEQKESEEEITVSPGMKVFLSIRGIILKQ